MNSSNINKFQSIIKITFYLTFLLIYPTNLVPKNLFDIKSKIEDSYYSFNVKSHLNLLNELKKMKDDEIKYYYLAFEFHTLGKIIYNDNSDKALKYFEYSINSIEKAIYMNTKKNKSFLPEYYALLSSALGKKSSLSGLSSFYWGLEAKKAFDKAFDLDSNNRKVRLIGAIHLMHVPEFLGGSKDKARATLLDLLNKSNKEVNSLEIKWTEKTEIFAYLAQIDILEGKKSSDYIDSALKYQNNYDFVNIDLKNQLKK